MKFVEMYLGELVNVDEISYLYSDQRDTSERAESFLVTKSGQVFPFLEVPDIFNIEKDGDKLAFDYECVDLWHKYVLEEIAISKKPVITLKELMDESWDSFVDAYRHILGKCCHDFFRPVP